MRTNPEELNRDDPEELVSDPQLRRELGITAMTWWRWRQDPRLAAYIPQQISIRGRNYRTRLEAERMKRELVRQALKLGAKREGDKR